MKRVILYHRGKRATKKKLNKVKVFGLIFVIILILISVIFFYNFASKSSDEEVVSEPPANEENIVDDTSEVVAEEDEKKYVEDANISDTIDGYNVLGQIVIDKIGIKQNILSKTENASLKLGVTRFYGPKALDEAGNFCICGHNWNNIFKNLSEMDIGDEFYIIIKDTKERIDYQIYDMYSCEPENLSCLDQNQDGKREVTLITCNPGGLTRLICKAREI